MGSTVRIATVMLLAAGVALGAPPQGFPQARSGFPQARSGFPQARSGFPQARLSEAEWGSYHEREPEGPGTYAFGYDVEDPETGNTQFRQEQRHADGSVTGSYGSVQPDGNVQIVHYTADHLGYRVRIENSIRKNEDFPPRPAEHSAQFETALASQSAPPSSVHEQHVRPISAQGNGLREVRPISNQGNGLREVRPISNQGNGLREVRPIGNQGNGLPEVRPISNQGNGLREVRPVSNQGNGLREVRPISNQGNGLRDVRPVSNQGNGLTEVRPISNQGSRLPAVRPISNQGYGLREVRPASNQGNGLTEVRLISNQGNDALRNQYQVLHQGVSKVRKVYPISDQDLRRQFSRPSDWQGNYNHV